MVCSGIYTPMSHFFVLYALNFGKIFKNCTFFVFLILDMKKRYFTMKYLSSVVADKSLACNFSGNGMFVDFNKKHEKVTVGG